MVKLSASLSTTILAVTLALCGGALAQSTDTQSTDTQGQTQQGTQAQGTEAQQPAADAQPAPQPDSFGPPTVDSPECAWIGQRILQLLWRDDIDTAKDFEEIYDRFGCPTGHEGPAFRCLVQIGVSPEEADPGLPERAKACWQNPALDPTTFLPPAQPQQPKAE